MCVRFLLAQFCNAFTIVFLHLCFVVFSRNDSRVVFVFQFLLGGVGSPHFRSPKMIVLLNRFASCGASGMCFLFVFGMVLNLF